MKKEFETQLSITNKTEKLKQSGEPQFGKREIKKDYAGIYLRNLRKIRSKKFSERGKNYS